MTFGDTVVIMAIWLVISLVPQVLFMASRRDKEFIDYSVIAFRFALGILAATVLAYRVFDVPAWITLIGWFILDMASTVQTVYMGYQVRKSSHSPRPKVYEDVDQDSC